MLLNDALISLLFYFEAHNYDGHNLKISDFACLHIL